MNTWNEDGDDAERDFGIVSPISKHDRKPTRKLWILVPLLVLLLIICSGCSWLVPNYEIEHQQMVVCNADTEIQPCQAQQVSEFLPGESICIAWTEVDRKSGESLAVYIYDERDVRVFELEESEAKTTKENRVCRVYPVEQPLEPGQYETEFVVAGRPDDDQQVNWLVATPTPTPIPAIPPSFQIEQPRMVICNTFAEISPCEAYEISEFLPGESICIAWTEVDRKSGESLAVYIYDERDVRVFELEESEAKATKENRVCRVYPVEQPLEPGQYETDFVVAGRPDDAQRVNWLVATPTPTPVTAIVRLDALAIPAGYMSGDKNHPTDYIRQGANPSDCHTGADCIKITYTTGGNWGGVVWWPLACGESGSQEAFDKIGKGICAINVLEKGNLSQVERLTFWAKGNKGVEVVEFGLGGETWLPVPGRKLKVTLTPAWQQYEIDVAKLDLTRAVILFSWFATDGDNPGGAVFYLDDIQFEGVRSPVATPTEKLMKVVATTSIVADLVKNVGGDKIDLSTLLPLGADPHTFSPTPADLTKIAEARVIFINGFGLELFLSEMLKNAGGQAPVVALSTGLKPRQLAATETGHQDEHPDGVDPHTWTTPAHAIVFARNIEQALSALDPANTKTYEANMVKYTVELTNLDNWVKAQIDQIPPDKRRLVTDHESLGYYADRYGLELVGAVLPAVTTGAEPSAQQLADLETAIKKYGVKAIFVDTTVNPVLSQRVADDTGIKLVRLYSGSLGEPGGEASTYLDYIRYNTTAIANGLK